MFCPKCGSVLKSKTVDDKKILGCSCGYSDKENKKINLELKEKSKDIEILDAEELDVRDIVDEECPKCGHPKAYGWTRQIGPSDEPEDNVFRCVKCGHGWRERY